MSYISSQSHARAAAPAKQYPHLGVLILGEHPPDRLRQVVRQCEALGFDFFWYADEKFYRDPFVGLTVAAHASTRMRLGTGVTEPYTRHPALLAMAIASLDEVSGGRAVLGLGAGGSGFPAMGVARRSPPVALTETVRVVRALLRGQTVDAEGQVVRVRGARLFFPARADLPIYVAARAPRMLRVAGAVADGVIIAPYASPPGLRFALQRVAEGAGMAGRSLDSIDLAARVDVCVAADPQAARESVRSAVALPMWISYPNLDYLKPLDLPPLPQAVLDILAERRYERIPDAARFLPEPYLDHLAVAGTAAEVTARLRALVNTGASQVIIRPVPAPRTTLEDLLERLGAEVLPALREPAARESAERNAVGLPQPAGGETRSSAVVP